MANLIQRAARAFGRFTGLGRKPAEFSDLAVIDPAGEALGVASEPVAADPGLIEPSSLNDLEPLTGGPLDAPWTPEQITTSSETIAPLPSAELAVVAAGQIDAAPELAVSATEVPPIVAEVVMSETVAAVVTPEAAEVEKVEDAKAPVEMKPIPQPEPSVTFTQLYELISGEVNKRTDSAVTVYERLLTATREELDATRKNNRIAWSIGGVMTAVAAFGGIWAAGEVSATRVEVAGLKQQVTIGQHASAERDTLRADLLKTREASAKVELDAIKSRLDQALVVSADRDRLRGELDTIRRAKQEVEGELRLARAATTQPVSQAQPAAGRAVAVADKASGAERPDVWSVLLNGKDDR